jgi:hypothetical protein
MVRAQQYEIVKALAPFVALSGVMARATGFFRLDMADLSNERCALRNGASALGVPAPADGDHRFRLKATSRSYASDQRRLPLIRDA